MIMVISLLLLIAGSALYYRSFAFFPFALGAVLGVGAGILKVWLLDRTVEKIIHMEKEKAGNYAHLQYFIRFLLTGLALLLAALVPFLSIWGTAAGICTLQIATFFTKHSSGVQNGIEKSANDTAK